MRRECKKRGIESLKVVYSKEEPIRASYGSSSNDEQKELSEHDKKRRSIPGSTAFVPPAAGLIIASCVVRDIIADQGLH
jgi:tRNA A37 threonylcarbamoyladenosine dehydratase